jgi:hypothetical protein
LNDWSCYSASYNSSPRFFSVDPVVAGGVTENILEFLVDYVGSDKMCGSSYSGLSYDSLDGKSFTSKKKNSHTDVNDEDGRQEELEEDAKEDDE